MVPGTDSSVIYISKELLVSHRTKINQYNLTKHSVKPVLANIPQQSIPSCTPLINKQFAPVFHSDLMTG